MQQQLQARPRAGFRTGSRAPRVICKATTKERAAQQQTESLPVRAVVKLATEALRLTGYVQQKNGSGAAAEPPPRRLRRGDVTGVLRTLRQDYERDQYFVTGRLSDAIYSDDCLFADPTIAFRGRELWKRNLALLTPFLLEPAIQLKSLKKVPQGRAAPGASSGGAVLYAEWLLTCWLALPWRPYVRVNGSTTYDLGPENNQIVSHVEAWDISGLEALGLLFKPSDRAVWRRQQEQQAREQQARERRQRQGRRG